MNIFVSHAMSVGLAILVIIALVLSLNSISSQWSGFLEEYEPRHICAAIRNSIEHLHYSSDSNNSVLGRLYLSLPKKVGDNNYDISFQNRTIYINTTSYGYFCNVDNVVLTGRASSNNVYLEFSSPNVIRVIDG